MAKKRLCSSVFILTFNSAPAQYISVLVNGGYETDIATVGVKNL